MRFLDLIEAKKTGQALSSAQIDWMISAYVDGVIPDYQMAAFLMAVRWRGLDNSEAAALTQAMVASGERYSWPAAAGVPVDKHSTGGVGDKVSLVLAPLAAAAGCTVPMISGRGLGHTGGTLDKLESIPGMRADLSADELAAGVAANGFAMGAQTSSLVPADRMLYALRDATGTVDDTGLITASILSKKIAEGARALVLDVKTGSGAFFEELAVARALAARLRSVAAEAGLPCSALITDMSQPLGAAIGNSLEIEESLECLSGGGPADLRELVLALGAEMLRLAELDDDAAGQLSRHGRDPRRRRHRRRPWQVAARPRGDGRRSLRRRLRRRDRRSRPRTGCDRTARRAQYARRRYRSHGRPHGQSASRRRRPRGRRVDANASP